MRERPFTVAIDGGELHGHRAATGRPALLLHGGPALPDYMDGCAETLDGLFATIRYTQRGVPPSTVTKPYSIEAHVADALTVLDHFGLEQAWAIGHSWGGHLALHLAAAHPDRLLGLVCIDPLGAFDPFEEFGANLDRGRTPEQRIRAKEIEDARRRGEVTETELLERLHSTWPVYFVDPDNAPPFPADRMGAECSTGTNVSIAEHFERKTLEDALPHVQTPALFVHGKEDPLPLGSVEQTAALIPDAFVEVIPECGHFPWMEKPWELRAAVERFLDQLG